MTAFSADTAAARAGVSRAVVDRLTELGILETDGAYTDADVRRVHVTRALERSGLSVEALATLIGRGALSLEFIDQAGLNVFAAVANETFGEVAARTGIDVDQLVMLREMTTGAAAEPGIGSARTSSPTARATSPLPCPRHRTAPSRRSITHSRCRSGR